MDKLKPSGKPFDISKQEVWEAHRQARANQGASGVDGVMTLDEFEKEFCGGPDLGREYQRMEQG